MRVGIELLGVHFLGLFRDLSFDFRRLLHNFIATKGFEISLLNAFSQFRKPGEDLFERLRRSIGPWKLRQKSVEALQVLRPGAAERALESRFNARADHPPRHGNLALQALAQRPLFLDTTVELLEFLDTGCHWRQIEAIGFDDMPIIVPPAPAFAVRAVFEGDHTNLGQAPRVAGLVEGIRAWLDHLKEVTVRRAQHRLGKVVHRLEVLDGYLIVYLDLDRVIQIIRESDEPKPELIAAFTLTDVQAEAILNMRLRSLRRLEEMEIRREHERLTAERAFSLSLAAEEEAYAYRTLGTCFVPPVERLVADPTLLLRNFMVEHQGLPEEYTVPVLQRQLRAFPVSKSIEETPDLPCDTVAINLRETARIAAISECFSRGGILASQARSVVEDLDGLCRATASVQCENIP